jgi:hypothetical protein
MPTLVTPQRWILAYFQPAAGKLVGDQHAAVLHQRRDLGSLGARGGGRVLQHAIPSGLLTGKERRHRQHGARFLNIEEAAQMLGRVAKGTLSSLRVSQKPVSHQGTGSSCQPSGAMRATNSDTVILRVSRPDAAPQRLPATATNASMERWDGMNSAM